MKINLSPQHEVVYVRVEWAEGRDAPNADATAWQPLAGAGDSETEISETVKDQSYWLRAALSDADFTPAEWTVYGPFTGMNQTVHINLDIKDGGDGIDFDRTTEKDFTGCCRVRIRVTVKKPRITVSPPRVVVGPIRVTLPGGGSSEGSAPAAPRVLIEPDPKPEFPDVFCGSPTRIRNAETYSVRVRYSTTYRQEGVGCPSESQTENADTLLAGGEFRYLGCGRYRTSSMMCAEIRSWKVVSTERV